MKFCTNQRWNEKLEKPESNNHISLWKIIGSITKNKPHQKIPNINKEYGHYYNVVKSCPNRNLKPGPPACRNYQSRRRTCQFNEAPILTQQNGRNKQ